MKNQARKTCKTSSSLLNPKVRAKFVPIKENFDELNWKYEAYKKGSPNIYEQNLDKLKLTTTTNDLKVLELPSVDYLLSQMKSAQKQVSANKRDYSIYPSMRQKYASKFRDLISDKQQINDFLAWFEEKEREIGFKDVSESKKFHYRQNLIASGFNEMITQINSISRYRSQIFKMLWNKQNDEISQIMNSLHDHSTKRQKNYLQNIRSLHIDYQQQILELTKENYKLKKRLEEQSAISESSVNSLRIMRKKIKKYESIIKEISKSNNSLKIQNLSLLEENCKLLMQTKGISIEQSKVLSMRVLQIKSEKKFTRKKKSFKKVFKKIHDDADQCIEELEPRVVEEKKEELLQFLKKRIGQNPNEKLFILKQELLDDYHHENQQVEGYLKMLINTREIRTVLSRCYFNQEPKKNVGVETQICYSDMVENEAQTDPINLNEEDDHIAYDKMLNTNTNFRSSFKIEEENFEINLKKIKQKAIKVRNSHMIIEMNKARQFKRYSLLMNKQKKNNSQIQQKNDPIRQTQEKRINSIPTQQNQDIIQEQLNKSIKEEISQYSLNALALPKNNKKLKDQHFSSFLQETNKESQQMAEILLGKIESEKQEEQSKDQQNVRLSSGSVKKNKKPMNKELQYKNQVNNFLKKNKDLTMPKEPQKKLNKILLAVYKNLYLSGRTNFLMELVEVVRSKYGRISTYMQKVLHIIYMINYHKSEDSLLSSLSFIIGHSYQDYSKILSDDVSQLYFKLYFCLCLKNPKDNKFNIWKNHTNLKRLNSQNFNSIMKEYINESKLTYVKYKIQQFVGAQVDANEQQFFIQINPLLVYILQVYLVQKNNYYESYHELIEFISDEEYLTISSLMFLLELMCFDQNDKKIIVLQYFGNKREGPKSHCLRDCFYRLCVKYELPLFEFVCILKQDQSKQLHQTIKNEFFEIEDFEMWKTLRGKLQRKLRSTAQLTNSLITVLNKLSEYMQMVFQQGKDNNKKDVFSFLYKIILYIAYF